MAGDIMTGARAYEMRIGRAIFTLVFVIVVLAVLHQAGVTLQDVIGIAQDVQDILVGWFASVI
jgi:hypothetical protein